MFRFPFFSIITAAALFFAGAGSLFPLGQQTNTGPSRTRVLVLPFNDQSDHGAYVNTGLVSPIVFQSLCSFIGAIPGIEVPAESKATNPSARGPDMKTMARDEKADLVIYGSYAFAGPRDNPQIRLRMDIWNDKMGRNTLEQVFNTTGGVEIFDAIDEMIRSVVTNALKFEYSTARLNIGGFRTGKEKYFLYINDWKADAVTSEKFSLSVKILQNMDYRVQLKRQPDNRVTMDQTVRMSSGGSTNITHTAMGSVSIEPIKRHFNSYHYFLDKQPAPEGGTITGLQAGTNHTLTVFDNFSRLVYIEDFYLSDGENKTFKIGSSGQSLDYVELGLRASFNYNSGDEYVANGKPPWQTTNMLFNFTTGLYLDMDYLYVFISKSFPIYGSNIMTYYWPHKTNTIYPHGGGDDNTIGFVAKADFKLPIVLGKELTVSPFLGVQVPFTIYTSSNTNNDGELLYEHNLVDHVYLNLGVKSDIKLDKIILIPEVWAHCEISDLVLEPFGGWSYNYISNVLQYMPRNSLEIFGQLKLKYYLNNHFIIEPFVYSSIDLTGALYYTNTVLHHGGNSFDSFQISAGADIGWQFD